MPRTRLKICCIASHHEATLAAEHGADVVGLVTQMPSGPGVIEETTARAIARKAPASLTTFLLSSLTDGAALVEQAHRCRPSAMQLVRWVGRDGWSALRAGAPWVKLVQVIHVNGPEARDQAAEAGLYVDALLLDSGNPSAAVPELGGTGRVHDWALSRQIVARAQRPVWLAGGLRPDNVASAIAEVAPWGLDVCSGVRTDGALDPDKLRAFAAAIADAAR